MKGQIPKARRSPDHTRPTSTAGTEARAAKSTSAPNKYLLSLLAVLCFRLAASGESTDESQAKFLPPLFELQSCCMHQAEVRIEAYARALISLLDSASQLLRRLCLSREAVLLRQASHQLVLECSKLPLVL